jgi:hypothetical protein
MEYSCLGYIKPGKFEDMSESERNTMLDERFSYNDEPRKNVSWDSTTESVSEFGHRLPKDDHLPATQPAVSDLQCWSFYWHAFCG